MDAPGMRFAVETWAPEYGVAADEAQLAEPSGRVDIDIETPGTRWEPIHPPTVHSTGPVVFVDGVRRIDARVWIADGDHARIGVCATVAAGAVRCADGSAEVVAHRVCRGLFAAADAPARTILTRAGAYESVSCVDDTAEKLYLGIHEHMTGLETDLAVGDDVELIVYDGPLRGRTDPRGVGYVKTHDVQYLPVDQQRLVGRLEPGVRTPMFEIGGRGFVRWSWYLRLPGPIAHPLSGVVRCELVNRGTLENASAMADLVTALLPTYASAPHKDPRAPQNLYPIAGLERELRRRMGDPQVLERALRLAATGTR